MGVTFALQGSVLKDSAASTVCVEGVGPRNPITWHKEVHVDHATYQGF